MSASKRPTMVITTRRAQRCPDRALRQPGCRRAQRLTDERRRRDREAEAWQRADAIHRVDGHVGGVDDWPQADDERLKVSTPSWKTTIQPRRAAQRLDTRPMTLRRGEAPRGSAGARVDGGALSGRTRGCSRMSSHWRRQSRSQPRQLSVSRAAEHHSSASRRR